MYNQKESFVGNYLKEYFDNKKFYAEISAKKKIELINLFFKNEGLDSVVIGISGGVDSAVTLALFYHAAKK